MVLRYAGSSQDLQVSLLYYDKSLFCFSGKILFYFPLDNIVSFPAPEALSLCALVPYESKTER